MLGNALRNQPLVVGLLAATICSLLLALYTASYAVWLTAHPTHSDAEWGRRFIICVVAAAILPILAVAAFVARRMHRQWLCQWLIGLLAAANVATLVVCGLILCHRL